MTKIIEDGKEEKTTIQVSKETRDKLNKIVHKYGGLRQNVIIEFIANTILMNEGIYIPDFETKQFKIKEEEK
jgi:hypothetical protein